jgi:hypothetical protein
MLQTYINLHLQFFFRPSIKNGNWICMYPLFDFLRHASRNVWIISQEVNHAAVTPGNILGN